MISFIWHRPAKTLSLHQNQNHCSISHLGWEIRIGTERMRSWVKATRMSFLCRLDGLCCGGVRSSEQDIFWIPQCAKNFLLGLNLFLTRAQQTGISSWIRYSPGPQRRTLVGQIPSLSIRTSHCIFTHHGSGVDAPSRRKWFQKENHL